jgi:putative SOS response-associated peptidase YedK
MAGGGAQPRAPRRHLADRSSANHPPAGRRGRARAAALGLPPAKPKGPPIINFRSEKRHFPAGRCLVPASHFYEFTGAKSPKAKWKFTKSGEDWFCFAGLWRPMPDGSGEAFTLLTVEPGPDVAPIHNRQMVVLERADWLAWLDLARPEAELLRALPAGSLSVEQVR